MIDSCDWLTPILEKEKKKSHIFFRRSFAPPFFTHFPFSLTPLLLARDFDDY